MKAPAASQAWAPFAWAPTRPRPWWSSTSGQRKRSTRRAGSIHRFSNLELERRLAKVIGKHWFGTVAPLGRIIETELRAKLDDPEIALDWSELRAADIASRDRAFQSMVGGGMELDRAAALSGLLIPDAEGLSTIPRRGSRYNWRMSINVAKGIIIIIGLAG